MKKYTADTYFKWAYRRVKCNWCNEYIAAGTPMVRVKLWKIGEWSYRKSFHPNCYVEQGLDYLEKNPQTFKRIDLSEVDRRIRLKLQRRYHHCKKKLDSPDDTVVATALLEMTLLREKIRDFGGVPKKWLRDEEVIGELVIGDVDAKKLEV